MCSPVLLLDSEGNRLYTRYYQPPAFNNVEAGAVPPGLAPWMRNPYQTHKQQRTLEKAVLDKARRASGDMLQYDSNLVLFKASYDTYLFVIAPERENELMMQSFLTSLFDALEVILQSQVDRHTVLENLDVVTLAIDETVDDGIILETDSTAIAGRVTRPRAETIEVQINEQSALRLTSAQECIFVVQGAVCHAAYAALRSGSVACRSVETSVCARAGRERGGMQIT